MRRQKLLPVALLLASLTPVAALSACGGPAKNKDTTPTTSSASASASAATSASAAMSASAAPSASVAAPVAKKGVFISFTKNAQSGKVDKVGHGDGDFKPDGVKDIIYDVEYEGSAAAIFLVTTDREGTPTGDFAADTLNADQTFPDEIAPTLNAGKYTAGIFVYEGDKNLNDKTGGLVTLADGKHKLTLHISVKATPKGTMRVMAMMPDRSLVKGPMLK